MSPQEEPSKDFPYAVTLQHADDDRARRTRDRKRAFARAVRRGLLAAVVLVAAVLVVVALRPRPVPVDAARASRGPLVVAIEESGMTRVKDRYVVSAPVAGSIARLALEPGDQVHEGDVIAVIVPPPSALLDDRTRAQAEGRVGASLSALGQTRAQVARARAARELADQELARISKLAASGALSPDALEQAAFDARMRAEELTSAEFAARVANEEVVIARAALGSSHPDPERKHHVDVVAPVSGRVLRVLQKSATVVQAGAVLLEVGDPAALEIVVDLLTTDAVRITPGTPATIEGFGGEEPLAGRVRRLEPSAFTRPSALGVDEQRVNVLIALTDPRDRWAALADGYRVEARLVLWRGADVLKVPHGAVFRHGSGWAAFRIDGGVARLTPVVVGHRGETEVEVVSGLSAGVEIAVHPGDRVKEGVRVERR
jgi:HlyD family secretion protein